jgi:hypothetical protein
MVESQGVLTNTPTTTQQTASLTDEQILSVLAAQSGVAAPALVAFSSVTSIAAPIDVAVANGLVPLTTGQMVVAGHSVG